MKFSIAGITNRGLRDNNEDNLTLSTNISKGLWMKTTDGKMNADLGQMGCLMVVADGMGGQNAGEVASEIAIDTVQDMFTEGKISQNIVNDSARVKDFMQKVIIEADRRVKHRSSIDEKTENMGSTMVMAWMIKNMTYVAWLGDSRAYAVLPSGIIKRLSKDHSLVQGMVDKGLLTEQEAMNHPNSNVITRSLGDPMEKAKPDVTEHKITEKGEVLLLCSDGLCGFVEDETIAKTVNESKDNIGECAEKLVEKALQEGSNDNITVALFRANDIDEDVEKELKKTVNPSTARKDSKGNKHKYRYLSALLACISLLLLCFVFWPKAEESNEKTEDKSAVNVKVENTKASQEKPKPEERQSIIHDMKEDVATQQQQRQTQQLQTTKPQPPTSANTRDEHHSANKPTEENRGGIVITNAESRTTVNP